MCKQIREPTTEESQITTAYKVFRIAENNKPRFEYWQNNKQIYPNMKSWNKAKHKSKLLGTAYSDYNPQIEKRGFCAFRTIEQAKSWGYNFSMITKIKVKNVTGVATNNNTDDTLLFEQFKIVEILQEGHRLV